MSPTNPPSARPRKALHLGTRIGRKLSVLIPWQARELSRGRCTARCRTPCLVFPATAAARLGRIRRGVVVQRLPDTSCGNRHSVCICDGVRTQLVSMGDRIMKILERVEYYLLVEDGWCVTRDAEAIAKLDAADPGCERHWTHDIEDVIAELESARRTANGEARLLITRIQAHLATTVKDAVFFAWRFGEETLGASLCEKIFKLDHAAVLAEVRAFLANPHGGVRASQSLAAT